MRAESLGTLPGEISFVRAGEKSAEAVVARKRLKGRGAKGRRTTQQAILTISVRRREGLRNRRTQQLRQLFGWWARRRPVDSGRTRARVFRVEARSKEEARRC